MAEFVIVLNQSTIACDLRMRRTICRDSLRGTPPDPYHCSGATSASTKALRTKTLMEWTTALSLAARIGKKSYDNRYAIQKYWTHLKVYLDLGATQIVVTGHAGAGKTLLTSQMHGRARELGMDQPLESLDVEVSAVSAGSWSKLVRVLPGQDGYRSKGAIESFQDNNQLEGAIHVVDFGYQAPRDSVVANALINTDGLTTIEKLRQRNLRLELEDLRVFLSDIRRMWSTYTKPKWIVVAVNKVDLFADDREAALAHYHPAGTSDFSRMLSEFQRDLGAQNIGVYVLQVCAYEKDFQWNGEVRRSLLERQEQDKILLEFTRSVATISTAHS